MRLRRFLPGLVLALGGCGQDPATGPVAEPEPFALPAGYRRLAAPELAAAREAVEFGYGERGLALLERVQGFEAGLLRARAHFLAGDSVAALAELEEARTLDPGNPEVAALEVELLAALDRLQGAAEILGRAMKGAGHHPALLRAQGVIELRLSGHGREALAALERARALDPELPFLRYPLAQAQVLAGRADLEARPAEALARAQAAGKSWPGLVAALELEAEAHVALLDYGAALTAYEALEAQGQDHRALRASLEQRWAMLCLLDRDREQALEHALAARALGLSKEELGFTAELLAEAAEAALERGLVAAEREDWSSAGDEFARALELAPEDLVARNHLAVAHFERQDYRAAAEAWSLVWSLARRDGVELPDPVPLNLAKAWRLAGERGLARAALEELLTLDPEGSWSESARELLFQLEAEELAGK